MFKILFLPARRSSTVKPLRPLNILKKPMPSSQVKNTQQYLLFYWLIIRRHVKGGYFSSLNLFDFFEVLKLPP